MTSQEIKKIQEYHAKILQPYQLSFKASPEYAALIAFCVASKPTRFDEGVGAAVRKLFKASFHTHLPKERTLEAYKGCANEIDSWCTFLDEYKIATNR